MKTRILLPFSVLALLTMVGCQPIQSEEQINTGNDYDYNQTVEITGPTTIDITETNDEFEITTSDGQFAKEDSIYRISKGGTYSLKGKLIGQVLVEAPEDEEVVIELNNVSISYGLDSPIKAISGSKLEISAKKNSENIIKDTRNHKSVDVDAQGEGAISSGIDLKLKGTGTLVVEGNYNNGIHTTKDLTIQKLTLKSTGYNNGLKGKDSVTITSGSIQSFSLTGDGIKTDDSDISSKGKQRGTIAINGGAVYVDSLHDGLDASYNVEIDQLDDEAPTSITVKTGKYSENYSSSTFVADSEKGIKSANDILIEKGIVAIQASDDAIHANYGETLENESTGTGNITINNGLIQIASGDDGLHADNTLTINGGKIVVTGAVEGFEANYINITGGYSYIYGSDDGVNCAKKSFSDCSFTMSGGYLDVAVRNGDTDGIDSNGDFTLTGGTIVTRGSPGTSTNRMSTGLDVDGTVTMTGGTLIAFNGLEKSPSANSTILYAGTSGANSSGGPGGGGPGGPGGWRAQSTTSLPAGNYTLTGEGIDISFTNDYVYATFQIYSLYLVLNTSYTLCREDVTVCSWTQSSTSTTIK